MLRNLIFVAQFAYISTRPKKGFVFPSKFWAAFVIKSIFRFFFKVTFKLWKISSNLWKTLNSSTTPLEISNALNYHFTHIGPRLADNIPKTSVCFEDYITPSDSSFTLNETHCGVVHPVVSSLQVDKATDLDGISASLLKEACPEIVLSLTHIINLSIILALM